MRLFTVGGAICVVLLVLGGVPSTDAREAQPRHAKACRFGHAYNISCTRASRVAVPFKRRDVRRPQWIYRNPAGCEWQAFRRRDRGRYWAWYGSTPSPSFPLVVFVKQRGCTS